MNDYYGFSEQRIVKDLQRVMVNCSQIVRHGLRSLNVQNINLNIKGKKNRYKKQDQIKYRFGIVQQEYCIINSKFKNDSSMDVKNERNQRSSIENCIYNLKNIYILKIITYKCEKDMIRKSETQTEIKNRTIIIELLDKKEIKIIRKNYMALPQDLMQSNGQNLIKIKDTLSCGILLEIMKIKYIYHRRYCTSSENKWNQIKKLIDHIMDDWQT